MENVTQELQIILSQELNLLNKTIDEHSEFKKDLDVDSLDLMSVVVAVEEHFDIRFQQSDVSNMKTFAELRSLVVAKLNT